MKIKNATRTAGNISSPHHTGMHHHVLRATAVHGNELWNSDGRQKCRLRSSRQGDSRLQLLRVFVSFYAQHDQDDFAVTQGQFSTASRTIYSRYGGHGSLEAFNVTSPDVAILSVKYVFVISSDAHHLDRPGWKMRVLQKKYPGHSIFDLDQLALCWRTPCEMKIGVFAVIAVGSSST